MTQPWWDKYKPTTLIQTGWLCLIWLSIPSNLFYHWKIPSAYVDGVLVDYLLPKISLTHLLLLGWLGIWLGLNIRRGWYAAVKKYWADAATTYGWQVYGVTGLIALILAKTATGLAPISGGWYVLQLLLVFGFVLSVINFSRSRTPGQTSIVITTWWWSTVIMILFQATVAVLQFTTQGSIGGYWLLGEPDLSAYWGVATTVWSGHEKILAYGTTPHPNILAGYVTLSWLIMTWLNWRQWQARKLAVLRKVAWLAASAATIAVLTITQSWSAILALAAGLTILTAHFHKPQVLQPIKYVSGLYWLVWLIGVPLGLLGLSSDVIADTLSLSRRAWLTKTALMTWVQQPILGVGLNQFTTVIQKINPSPEVIKFLQPVHHLGLLWLAETGLAGLTLILWGVRHLWNQRREAWLHWFGLTAGLAPIAVWDHYLLTTTIGLLLVSSTIIVAATTWQLSSKT